MRQAIIEVADDLIYQRGYHQASFADLARAAGVPKGNFYYYFKSKDELLQAVIDRRLQHIRRQLHRWREENPDPRVCIRRVLQIPENEADSVAHYGCPMGTLTMELGKTDPAGQEYARQMFDLFRDFLIEQFEALGRSEQASALAMHLLTWMQGIAVMSCAYRDPQYLQQETAQLAAWLDAQLSEA